MDNLAPIDPAEAFKILSKVASSRSELSIKARDSEKIYTTQIARHAVRRLISISNDQLVFEQNLEVTIKVVVDKRLFFLKTNIKKGSHIYYFDNFDAMFELVRRKKPRFSIPEHWSQSAYLQGANYPIELKSPAKIIDFSKAGGRIKVQPELPKYQINQVVNFYFKVHRRAEILVKSKIIYLKETKGQGGPIVGLEFADNSILIGNKIQNICDDLAFYYAHLSD